MGIFTFLFLVGVINVIFFYVWNYAVTLPTAIFFTLIKFDRGIMVMKIFGTYIFVSMIALATFFVWSNSESEWEYWMTPVVGVFALYSSIASGVYERQKELRMETNFELRNRIERDSWIDPILVLGAPILYILMLLVPALSTNFLNVWLFQLVWWIYGLPVIGWLVGIGGVIVTLGMIWQGFIFSLLIGGYLYSKVLRKA